MSVKSSHFRGSFLICLFFIGQVVYAQNDSITVTSEFDEGQKNSYRYFSPKNFEQKTLFKLANDAFSNRSLEQGVKGIRLSVEQKLTRTISTEVGWVTPDIYGHGVFLNLRYYYNKGTKRSVKSGDNVNNFNGNYFLLGTHRRIADPASEYMLLRHPAYSPKRHTYSLLYGQQQNIGKWGFFDMSGGVEYLADFKQFQVSMNLKMGFSYGKFSREPDSMEPLKYEEFKNSYDSKKGIFKWYNPYLVMGTNWALGSAFSYERKITDNLSIIPTISMVALNSEQMLHSDSGIYKRQSNHKRADFNLETRYYYSQKKRLRSGQPLRSFTGSYIFLTGQNIYTVYKTEVKTYDSDIVRSGSRAIMPAMVFGWGAQQRLGGRGFFDLNLGMSYSIKDSYLHPYPLIGAKVGLLIGK